MSSCRRAGDVILGVGVFFSWVGVIFIMLGGGSICERGEACFRTGDRGVLFRKLSELVLLSSF